MIRFGAQTVALAHTIMNTDRYLQLVRVLNLSITVEAGLAVPRDTCMSVTRLEGL